MTSRTIRAQTAQETLNILDRGWYVAPSGRQVIFADALKDASAKSILYQPNDFDALYKQRDEIGRNKSTNTATVFQVANITTLSAAKKILEARESASVVCLNFASAKHPGGGFLSGSQAQEESLARATGLYPCIAQMHAMYQANKRLDSCLYTDHMIYSPGVPVFRDDKDILLEEPWYASFITAPAVNAGAVMSNEKQNVSQIGLTMLNRIEKLLSIAVIHDHNVLVLGAWGCGVFKNSPTDVANWFKEQLVSNRTFNQTFKTIVFAVLDHSTELINLKPFVQAFEPLQGG